MPDSAPIKLRDLKVERVPIDSLKPYPRNARTHSKDQIEAIAASMREFGWTNPALVDQKLNVIAGHGRIEAAKLLGMTEALIIRLKGLTPTQIKALIIADNQIALRAGWDENLLRLELGEIKAEGFDLSSIGFDPDALQALLTGKTADGLTDPEATPEPPVEPVSRLGDIWLLGDHRIICGDSTDKATVEKLLGADRPHLMVTDPPYGVEYDADWRNSSQRANGKPFGGRAVGKVENDDRIDWADAWSLFEGDVAYVWHGALHVGSMSDQLQQSGFALRALIVWAKNNFAVSRGHYHWKHETCWYAVKKGATGHWSGDRSQTTLWEIDKPMKSETGHSTQKPVECMRRPIANNSRPGDAVYEPFSGSGTTIIAAEQTGRRCLAIELSPAYVDVAVQRWEGFTGKTATLQATGETFATIGAQRAGKPASAPKEKAGRKGPAQKKAA